MDHRDEIDSQGLTPEDFAADPDFADYYLGGAYDMVCSECGGLASGVCVGAQSY